MGMQERLAAEDAKIKALEEKIWSPKEPAEVDAATQTTQGADLLEETQASAATESPDEYVASENKFDVNFKQPVDQAVETNEEQEEPTSQKRVSWKNRYTKLKQYHDADKFKTRTLIGQLFDKITELEADNKRLSTRVQELLSVEPQSIKDLVTPEELDRIGEQELDIVSRLTAKAIDAKTAELQKRLEKAEAAQARANQDAGKSAKVEAYNIFLGKLGALVPDYAELDVDPRFGKWLDQPDPASGFKRMELFKQAEASGDVGRVASFFKDFKEAIAPHKKTLDSIVTPVGNTGAQPVVDQQSKGQPKIIPMAEYMKFMNAVTRGAYRGRESEARALEAMYDKAIAEGRIRQ